MIDQINGCQATGIKKQQNLFSLQGLVDIFISFKRWRCNEEDMIKVIDNTCLLFIENYMFIITRFLYFTDWNGSIANGPPPFFFLALPNSLYCINK